MGAAAVLLFHVPDQAKALSEIRRVLRPGGHLYAATGGAANLRELAAFKPDRDNGFGRESRFGLENGVICLRGASRMSNCTDTMTPW
jgi:SAM-dependent methyltransferase